MNRKFVFTAVVGATLGGAAELQAHHSGSMYQASAVWVSGTVERFEPSNPHTITRLTAAATDRPSRAWAIEGPAQSQLDRLGIGQTQPQTGAVIAVCSFPYKSRDELARLFPDADFSGSRVISDPGDVTPQYAAGHVILMADGALQFWEPHGLLAECIRSGDLPRQVWIDFLNADARAWQAWCEQRNYEAVRSNPALQAVVAEFEPLLGRRCR